MATLRYRAERKVWLLDWREGGKRQQLSLGNISKKEAEIALKRKEYELLNPDVTVSRVTVEKMQQTKTLI